MARDYRAVYDALMYKAERTDSPDEAKILTAKAAEIKAAHPDVFQVVTPPRITDIITDADFAAWVASFTFNPYQGFHEGFGGQAGKSHPPGAASGKFYDPDYAKWSASLGYRGKTAYYIRKDGYTFTKDPPDYSYGDAEDPGYPDPQDGTGW